MRILLLILFGSFSLCSLAQTGDDEWLDFLRKEQVSCDALSTMAMDKIPDLLRKENVDSALYLYQNWDKQCPNYYVLSLRLLWAVQYDSVDALMGMLSDLEFIRWYDEEHLLSHHRHRSAEEIDNNNRLQRYVFSDEEEKYWIYIKIKAAKLSKQYPSYPSSSFRYAFARFLAHDVDPLYEMLEEPTEVILPKGMQQSYDIIKEERINTSRSEVGLYANVWVPFDNLNQLGVHPGLGLFLGGSKNRFRYIARFNVNFLESANTYSVLQADTTVETDRFIGYYVGFEVDYVFYTRTHHEWSLGAGAGYSGIEAVENTAFEDESSNAVFLNSLDLSLGIEYRYYSKKYSYLGFGIRYSANNYNNRIDNTMQGNTMNFRLIYGFAPSGYGYNNLGLR